MCVHVCSDLIRIYTVIKSGVYYMRTQFGLQVKKQD